MSLTGEGLDLCVAEHAVIDAHFLKHPCVFLAGGDDAGNGEAQIRGRGLSSAPSADSVVALSTTGLAAAGVATVGGRSTSSTSWGWLQPTSRAWKLSLMATVLLATVTAKPMAGARAATWLAANAVTSHSQYCHTDESATPCPCIAPRAAWYSRSWWLR